MEKRYYILNIDPVSLKQLIGTLSEEDINSFVEEFETLRWNNDNTKCIVKLKQDIVIIPEVLKDVKSYSNGELRIVLSASDEWIDQSKTDG